MSAACAHCGQPPRGFAAVGDARLCHPDEGLDCYRLVTIYRHAMPCGACRVAEQGTENPSVIATHGALYAALAEALDVRPCPCAGCIDEVLSILRAAGWTESPPR